MVHWVPMQFHVVYRLLTNRWNWAFSDILFNHWGHNDTLSISMRSPHRPTINTSMHELVEPFGQRAGIIYSGVRTGSHHKFVSVHFKIQSENVLNNKFYLLRTICVLLNLRFYFTSLNNYLLTKIFVCLSSNEQVAVWLISSSNFKDTYNSMSVYQHFIK